MSRLSLRVEKLEQRRLMDADGMTCNLAEPTTSEGVAMSLAVTTGYAPQLVADGNDSTDWQVDAGPANQTFGFSSDATQPFLSFATYPSTQVYRSGSTLVAIASADFSRSQKLWVIREGGESGGEIGSSVELGRINVEQVLIDGDRLLVIGQRYPDVGMDGAGVKPNSDTSYFPQKKIIAIDLSTGSIAKEFEVPNSIVKYARFSDGQATVIAQRTDQLTPAIWPPIETSDDVYRFNWDEDGPSDLQTDSIPTGRVTVAGNLIFVAVQTFDRDSVGPNEALAFQSQTELRVYALTATGVESRGSIDVGLGNVVGIQVNDSGDQAAVAISSDGRLAPDDAAPWAAKVLIVDLTVDNQPVIKETIAIPQLPSALDVPNAGKNDPTLQLVWYQSLDLVRQDADSFVFSRTGSKAIVVVDLSDNVIGEGRLQIIELPEDVWVGQESVRLNDDQIVFLTGTPTWARPFLMLPTDSSSWPGIRSQGNGLLTVSLAAGTVKLQTLDGNLGINDLTVIDAETGRIGFQSQSLSYERKFVFGTLNDVGEFTVQGDIASDGQNANFYPHQASLTVATESGLKTYSYDRPNEPLYVIRFVDESASSLQATDDVIRLYASNSSLNDEVQSEWIDLLANDQIPYYSYFRTRIVELIDAPDGIKLEAGRFIRLDSRIQSLDEPIVFKYKISDDIVESIADVEITLSEVTDEQQAAMIAAVKNAASKQFGLPADSLTVEPLAYSNGGIPIETNRPVQDSSGTLLPPAFNTRGLTQNPQFTFRVTADGFKALYGSDLKANAYLIAMLDRDDVTEPLEPVVELSLVATDDHGNEVQTVQSGDSFWLEFRGKDLRVGAQGMFSAFLNLALPESLSFEGTVEPGEGFSFMDASNVAGKVTGQSITSLGVIDADGVLPTSLGETPELLIRMRVIANKEGASTLTTAPMQIASEETTVFGLSDALMERQIKRAPLALVIGEAELTGDPTDVNGDGSVQPVDALRVINMISRHGVGTIAEIKARMEAKDAEAANKSAVATDVRRFDVNRNGSVTPLDALLVINHIARENRGKVASGESPEFDTNNAALSTDPTLETPEQKRKRG